MIKNDKIRYQNEMLTDLLSAVQLHFETYENWDDWESFSVKKDKATGRFYVDLPIPDKTLRLNNSDDYEMLQVELSEALTPIAYRNKIRCLMENADVTEGEAMEIVASEGPIELELYYEIGYGLMAVESAAAESTAIFSPYTREEYEEAK